MAADPLARAASARLKAKKKHGSLRDFQLPEGTGRSAGSALRLIDSALGATGALKGLAGATTGMRSVKNPRDLLGREAGAAMAVGSLLPNTKGVAPAVAITTKMTQLRRALGVGNDREARRIAAEMAEMADMPMVPLNRNVRETLDRVLPLAEKGKIQAGGTYRLPVKGRYGEFVNDRTAIIQNPETGTMFVAPGAVHGEVILEAQKLFPDASPKQIKDWLQHEVYDQHAGYDAARKQTIPARFMKASAHGDTEAATIARAQFLQNLQRLGAVGDVKSAKAAREAMLAGTGPTRNVARDPAHVMAALTTPRGGPANRRVARAASVATERDIRDLLIRARKHPPRR